MDHKKHLPLAPRDLLILAVLGEGPLHGYGIIKAVELRSQAGVLLDPANLYRVLRRMSRLGWIRQAANGGPGLAPVSGEGEAGSVPAEPSSPGGASAMRPREATRETFERSPEETSGVPADTPPTRSNTDARRKTYEITPQGQRLLAAEVARLERLLEHARPALADGPTPPWHRERDSR